MIFPTMPKIAVQIVATVEGESEGAYIRKRGSGPLRIEIAEQAQYPQLTAAHEFAHYLDDCGFPASRGWASETELRLDTLRQSWENTDAVRALRAGSEMGRITAYLPNGASAELPLMPAERENCRYYLRGREIFARGYAQYLAERSKNMVLLQQVRQRRECLEGRLYHVQWSERDFRVISSAFDDLFGGLGWLR